MLYDISDSINIRARGGTVPPKAGQCINITPGGTIQRSWVVGSMLWLSSFFQ